MQGRGSAQLIYRDAFNAFDATSEDDNLVHSYVPIRRDPAGPVLGVFELYTDVRAQAQQIERSGLTILAGATLIFAALYGALVIIVRRARDIINQQQQAIQEKTDVLEQLSESNLRREDLERKKLASELHEGLAQTLSAIKMEVENAQRQANGVSSGPLPMQAVVPGLQAAIQQTRTIATDLHPSSLDDLGLLPTINAFCREYATVYPWVRVRRQITVKEESIPAPLKIVIYRVIETALKIIARQRTADDARIALEMHDRTLTLMVDANRPPSSTASPAATPAVDPRRPQSLQSLHDLTVIGIDTQSQLGAIRERTVLSGGRLLIEGNGSGGTRLHAWWQLREAVPVAPPFPAPERRAGDATG
jgi:two-component system, NarL family, sensor kinase